MAAPKRWYQEFDSHPWTSLRFQVEVSKNAKVTTLVTGKLYFQRHVWIISDQSATA